MANDKLRDNSLVHLSLVRPVTMLMVLLSFIVIGIVALVNIPIELIPSGFSPPFMQVEVPYANATAQDVEDRITRPLEQALSTTPGLDELSATSRADRSSLSLVFESDTDMNIAYREVRDGSRARGRTCRRTSRRSGPARSPAPASRWRSSASPGTRPSSCRATACKSTWSARSSASTASAW
jgi:hypothetical protein